MQGDSTNGLQPRVLVVEDEDITRDLLLDLLNGDGCRAVGVGTGEAALKRLAGESHDVVLLDLNLPGMHGLNVLSASTAAHTDAQFIMMTAHGSVDTAVEAMRLGAYDYVLKPFRTEELLLLIRRAHHEVELRREVAALRNRVRVGARARIIGRTPPMERLFELIERVAPMRATVLITGETGTGKELVARAVHDLSGRATRPFVSVSCSALPETLLESELFGHVKGSFTGAIASKRGLLEEAHGGTLFLDEIPTIPASVQVKLLRVLEERRVTRVGATQQVPVDFRLVAATNMDLAGEVAAGRFREDLFYRLDVFPIRVPPLRERTGDIPLLATHFRQRVAEQNGIEPPAISPATLERMMRYAWPGNVRELENFVERAVIMHLGSREIRFEAPGGDVEPEGRLLEAASREGWNLDRLEEEYLLSVLERTGGHQGRAARILGIDRRTLYRKLKRIRHRSSDGASVVRRRRIREKAVD